MENFTYLFDTSNVVRGQISVKGPEKADENVVNVLYAIAGHTITENDLHIYNWQIQLILLFSDVYHIDGFVQDCNISIANTPEILQSGTMQSILWWCIHVGFDGSYRVFILVDLIRYLLCCI